MSIITISRQYGSAGVEVAARVSNLLEYRYLDKEVIAAAASEVGLSEGEIVEFNEHHSKSRRFLDRILFPGPNVVAQVTIRSPAENGDGALTVEELDKKECLNLVQTAIHAEYSQGDAVIVGRGGQAVLQKMPNVLHVRIVAPMPSRILRIQTLETVDLEAAYEAAIQRDRKTAGYLSEVFGIDWDDPRLYHLVINTGKWTVEQAAQIVVHAARQLAG